MISVPCGEAFLAEILPPCVAELVNGRVSTRLLRDEYREHDSDLKFDNGMTKRMIGTVQAVYKVEFVAFVESNSDIHPAQKASCPMLVIRPASF